MPIESMNFFKLRKNPAAEKPVPVHCRQYKLILLGNSNSRLGNLSLMHRLEGNLQQTLVPAFATKAVLLDDVKVIFAISDTGGVERFHSLSPAYYRGTEAALLVYDIARADSFEELRSWLKDLRKRVSPNFVVAITGHETNPDGQREIPFEEAQAYADENNCVFMETCAMTGKNVNEIFLAIARLLQGKLCQRRRIGRTLVKQAEDAVSQQPKDRSGLQRELERAIKAEGRTRDRLLELQGQLEQKGRRQADLQRQLRVTQQEISRLEEARRLSAAENQQLQQQLHSSAAEHQQQQQQLEEKTVEISQLAEENERLRALLQLERSAPDETTLRNQLQRMTTPPVMMADCDRVKFYQMRAQLVEGEMQEIYTLFTSKLKDFNVKRLIDHGSEGAVFLATCEHPRIQVKAKQYALKVMFNIFRYATVTQVRKAFQNEYEILATLPFHENIVRLLAFFYDRMGEGLPGLERFDALRESAHTLSLFLIMDYLPVTLDTLSKEYRNDRRLTFEVFVNWSRQLAEAAHFLTRNRVVHRDMKLNNVLVTQHGQLKVCDFGFAIQTDNDELTVRYFPNMPLGGNPSHLSPEILRLSSAQGTRDGVFVAYTKQCVWELAVMMHELVSGQSPFEGLDQQGYLMADVPNITVPPSKSDKPSVAFKLVADDLIALVRQMLSFEPAKRPTISQVLVALKQYSERFPLS